MFLAGFLSRLVSAERGTGQVRLGEVLRSLPWGSLIAADLLAALIVVLGLVLLIIPGLIALNLLVVVGPAIEIEHRRAWAGLRRSAQLVRPHFWKVALIGTLPVLVANGLVVCAARSGGPDRRRDHTDRAEHRAKACSRRWSACCWWSCVTG